MSRVGKVTGVNEDGTVKVELGFADHASRIFRETAEAIRRDDERQLRSGARTLHPPFLREVEDRVRSLPGVSGVGFVDLAPLRMIDGVAMIDGEPVGWDVKVETPRVQIPPSLTVDKYGSTFIMDEHGSRRVPPGERDPHEPDRYHYSARAFDLTPAPGESADDFYTRAVESVARGYNDMLRNRARAQEEKKTMPQNPYDRRGRADDAGRFDRVMGQARVDGFANEPVVTRSPTLDVADLDAIAERHRWLGREEGRSEELKRAIEREAQACAKAWDKGRVAGGQEGERQVLDRIEEGYERAVRDLIVRIEQVVGPSDERREALKAADQDPGPTPDLRRVSKDKLASGLTEARDLLEKLIDAHHNRFVDGIPF